MTYPLKQWLSRQPGHAAAAVALLLLLLTWLVLGAALMWVELRRIDASHVHARQTIQATAAEVNGLLDEFNRSYPAVCSEAALKQLRVRLFVAEYVGDAGVLDEEGRVVCTATIGQLDLPSDMPAAEVSVPVNGRIHQINFRYPAFGTSGRILVVAVRAGRFVTTIRPAIFEQVIDSGVDAARLVLPNRTHALYVASTLPDGWRARLADPEFSSPQRRVLWAEGAVVAVSRVEGTRYVVQSVLPFREALSRDAAVLTLGFTLSLVLALLGYGAAKPLLQRWGTLDHRIDRLLRDENILCMYQPIIELASGRVAGCEVLMRLRDGDKIIFPDQALPAIIRRRLTWQLDQAVLRASIRQLLDGLPEVQDFKVAFNLFPENVRFAEVQATIAEALDGRQHAGLRFDLEVIEQHYQASILDELAQFKVADFLVSVDDFGTGYSNLGTIKSLAPDFLKIDKSFVFDMEEVTVRSSLIPEIIAIARAVGAQLVAEGIENETQLRQLHELGVEYGQGYHFARPMPIADLAAFVRAARLTH